MPLQDYCIARHPATIGVRTFTLNLFTPTYFTSYALLHFYFYSTYIYTKHPFYPTYITFLPLLYCQGFMCNNSLTFFRYNKNCIITLQGYEISHLLAVLIFSYRPDNGLFKPKHVAYFTLYCELCMTTWINKYIFLQMVYIFSSTQVTTSNRRILKLSNHNEIARISYCTVHDHGAHTHTHTHTHTRARACAHGVITTR